LGSCGAFDGNLSEFNLLRNRIIVDIQAMSNLLLRQNLSVVDRKAYFTSIWLGNHSSSFSSSQERGWLTDLELVGTDGDKWSSVQVHQLVVLPVFSSLKDFPLDTHDAKIVFPDIPTEVIRSLMQLIYTGECQLSPVADVVSILKLATVLGLFIHPERLKVCVKESGNKGITEAVEDAIANKNALISVEETPVVKKVSKRVLLIPMAEEYPAVTSDSDQNMNGDVSKENKKVKPVHHKFFCEHCNFSCRFWLGMEKHANTAHTDKKFRCEKCDFETSKLKNVKIHNKHIHVGVGRLVCEVCGFKAKTDNKLSWHVKHVHKLCADNDGKSVESVLKLKPTLKEKVKKAQRVKKSFPVDRLHCHVCDFKTFYKKSLAKHVLKFHESKNI